MSGNKTKNTSGSKGLKEFLKRKSFHRLITCILTVIIAFVIVENGAVPRRYKLSLWSKSPYDITAPRDIVNTIKTEENARKASDEVQAAMINLTNVPVEVLIAADSFISLITSTRLDIDRSLEERDISKKAANYMRALEEEQVNAVRKVKDEMEKINIPISDEQISYMISKVGDKDISAFKEAITMQIKNIMTQEITSSNLAQMINAVQNNLQNVEMNQELKNIGSLLISSILKPNSIIDQELTTRLREDAYNKALEVKVTIPKGTRILSVGDTVTEDKLKVLEDLNFLDTGVPDFSFAAGILLILLILAATLTIYMSNYCKKILQSTSELILLCVIILLTILISRVVHVYSTPLIPITLAAMLISILLDLRLAIFVNMLLTIALSFITKGAMFNEGDMAFVYISLVSGTFSAFIVSRANQRSKLSASGLLIAGINVLITAILGIINKNDISSVAYNSLLVSINGLVSIVLTIGILPFLESTFNVITPLKLLELANPNQPLIKRLLLEAPGTYHHSLMVGNLAEVATEAINGNALLARVGACYHDVGKLKRPNFFRENQMTENPHDKMTANLSTLVITSHTADGIALANQYKLPMAIKDIICQHHGTTLVAYFYHKAKKGEKGESVKPEDFRYEGPRPMSKEAAVVMLADSVEAAVRSMVDKTEGKIEGLVRKIIKDKLDDGQLDLCELTLKDLDVIAQSFMRVFSGYFHEREAYPEVKERISRLQEGIDAMDAKLTEVANEDAEGEKVTNGNIN